MCSHAACSTYTPPQHINSTCIDDHPVINPNVLEAEWDRWILAKATAYGRRFFQTESMLEVFEPGEVYPGSSVQTEKQWEEYVTNNINIGVSFFFIG
jgi:hypothetical protein